MTATSTAEDEFAARRGCIAPVQITPSVETGIGVGGVRHKLTAEQEAYRVSRVQAALKGKPATDMQREARAAGLRKAWAEGRIKPSATPESIAKTAAKLRGRKRPPEVIAKVRMANLGKKRSQEQVEAMRQRVIAGHAIGKYKSSPEGAERRRLASIAAHLGKPRTEAQKRHHSEMLTGRTAAPEHVEARVAPMRGRPQVAECTKRGPTNKGSIEGALRDSCGRIWWFRNLSHFVRTHPELFDAEDLIERRMRPNKPAVSCNAIKRLLALFGHGKVVPGTWKGWTVGSSTIERVEGHADLLGRDESEPVSLGGGGGVCLETSPTEKQYNIKVTHDPLGGRCV